jgi:hypothetical protein
MRITVEIEGSATSFTEVGVESWATVASRCTRNRDVPPFGFGIKKNVLPLEDV